MGEFYEAFHLHNYSVIEHQGKHTGWKLESMRLTPGQRKEVHEFEQKQCEEYQKFLESIVKEK